MKNLHYPYVLNQETNDTQMLILFNANNLMTCHSEHVIFTNHINKLDEVLSTQHPLNISRRKAHERVGITTDFSLKIGCAISHHDFI